MPGQWVAYGDSLAEIMNETLGYPRDFRRSISISGHGLEVNNLAPVGNIPPTSSVIFSTGWNDPMAADPRRRDIYLNRVVNRLLEINQQIGGRPIVVMGLEERAGHGDRDHYRVTATNQLLNEAIAQATSIARAQGRPVNIAYLDLETNPIGPGHSADFRSASDGLHYNSAGASIIRQRVLALAGSGQSVPPPPLLTSVSYTAPAPVTPRAPAAPQSSDVAAAVTARDHHIIRAMQQRLNELGFNSGEVDGRLGGATRGAWGRFETRQVETNHRNVSPDGVIAQGELQLLLGASALAEDRAITGNSDAVKAIQSKLNALGYDCGAADGVFGTRTSAAWHRFEQAAGGTRHDELVSRQEVEILQQQTPRIARADDPSPRRS